MNVVSAGTILHVLQSTYNICCSTARLHLLITQGPLSDYSRNFTGLNLKLLYNAFKKYTSELEVFPYERVKDFKNTKFINIIVK